MDAHGLNLCIGIIAHERAAQTIADFQPRWERLKIPLYGFVPEGDQWPGKPLLRIFQQGESIHRGDAALRRFVLACETMMTLEYDAYCLMEYDTVNLNDAFPAWDPFSVCAGYMAVHDDRPPVDYMVAFSPWIVTRPMMAALLEAMRIRLKHPVRPNWVSGLVDRWLATVIIEGFLPAGAIKGLCPWPHNRNNPHAEIKTAGWTWVHGWKTKEDFGDLWPTA